MLRALCIPVATCLMAGPLNAGPQHATRPADLEASLGKLSSKDAETRLEGLCELENSEDPRVAERCIALLSDKGNTVKRKAARMIGSRARLIPKSQRPKYIASLKDAATKEEDTFYASYVRRALGILENDFSNSMFEKSPDGRFAVYERLGVPEVIDMKTGEFKLLVAHGEEGEPIVDRYGSGNFEGSVFWEKSSRAFAVALASGRHSVALLVWVPSKGIIRGIEAPAVLERIVPGVHDNESFVAAYGFAVEGWSGLNPHIVIECDLGLIRATYDPTDDTFRSVTRTERE